MATLVLTTVGTLVGGPVGGLIGAVVGQQVDQRLFAPKRVGPRLGDLSVQMSRYGQPIPKLFGTMRVAGSVIWATDLKETVQSDGGGKGKPKMTNYSYSASLAVALSARPIRAVRRIWADGKLLRGAAGDWKSELGAFRLYLGTEDHAADPLIAAMEGEGATPAYRGMAYAVFEHLQLADFANHIPSLTFEVEADEGPVTLGAIAGELGDGEIAGAAGPELGGFAASGDSVRGAIEALARVAGPVLADDGAVLRFADPEAAAVALGDLGAPRARIERKAAGTLPELVELSYYEPARDYLAGLQRARRDGPGRRGESIELAAALGADSAKALAEQRLATAWTERSEATVKLGWRWLALRPGQCATLPDQGGTWRVRSVRIEAKGVEAKLVPLGPLVATLPPAAPGRPVGAPDAGIGETVLHLLDLPPLGDTAETSARLWVAAAGTEPGWRRAGLSLSRDGGASFEAIGSTAAPAVIGVAASALAAGSAHLFDGAGDVEIDLLHGGMALAGADDDALANGANLALLGDELIQFGMAEALGSGRWRLSRLLRGRRGSEWAMAGHAAGERFVLLERASLLPVELPVAMLGASATLIATGVGDAAGVEAEALVTGDAVRPPAPVGLAAARLSGGLIRFSWVRRSRTGWAWLDGSDAPLGEEAERYRLEIMPSTGSARTVEPTAASIDYDPAPDGAGAAASFAISVRQLGSVAASRAASATFMA